MLGWLRKSLCADLAIDLGTCSTRIGLSGDGIRLDEPSVVAVSRSSSRVAGRGLAVGRMAAQMLGRTPEGIRAVRPLQHGVINDFELCEVMLRYFLQKSLGGRKGLRPRVLIAVPGRITAVERRAVFNSAERAGAGRIWLIDQSRAAGIGAGLPVAEPLASMVCDIGSGSTDISVLSLADVVAAESIRTAGDAMDEAIARWLRRRYSLRVGSQSCEALRIGIGSAAQLDDELSREVSGLDTASGNPRRALVTSEEVRAALLDPLNEIVDAIRRTIERCQPELIADLADTGLMLTGGGSLLRGLDRFLSQQLGIPVRLADSPRLAVTQGAMICLDHLERWRSGLDDGLRAA